jgi:hypothetical protein
MSFGSVLTVTAALWTEVPDSSTMTPLIPACAVVMAAIVANAKKPIFERFIIYPFYRINLHSKKRA